MPRFETLVSCAWLALLTTFVIPACADQDLRPPLTAQNKRSAPPSILACDTNQLTSFDGVVSVFQRGNDSTTITINTDWDTIETVTIEHPDPQGLLQFLMQDGQPFEQKDWSRIETEPGILIDGMRAVVWFCLDETTQPVIDWRPAEPGHQTRSR